MSQRSLPQVTYTETLLRFLLPLSDKVHHETFQCNEFGSLSSLYGFDLLLPISCPGLWSTVPSSHLGLPICRVPPGHGRRFGFAALVGHAVPVAAMPGSVHTV